MSDEVALNIIAALLVALTVVNIYFVWHGGRLYFSVNPRSPILLALFGVKVVIWLVGGYISIISLRVLLAKPPLPFSGIGLGLVVLIMFLLPAFIWSQMLRAVKYDADKDNARNAARDEGRDEGRDAPRDAARDLAHDQAAEAEHTDAP